LKRTATENSNNKAQRFREKSKQGLKPKIRQKSLIFCKKSFREKSTKTRIETIYHSVCFG